MEPVKLKDYAARGILAIRDAGYGPQPTGPEIQRHRATVAPKRQTVVLPAPPSANRYWRVVKGRAVKSREARKYQERIKGIAVGVYGLPQGKPVGVEVRWARRKRMGDLDNRLKCLLDALKGIGWTDDKQIVELHAYRTDGGNDTVTVTWWAA